MVKRTKEFNFIDNERRTTTPKITYKKMLKNNEMLNEGTHIIGHGVHIHGGALPANELQGLLDASYDRDIKSIGGWVQDEDLSTNKSKVFYDPKTGKAVVVHRGTVGTASDWNNNLTYALGCKSAYKDTERYKSAKKIQDAASAKYGNSNITTIGHSQGGLQAEMLGKHGAETITLNKATRPFSNKPSKNQTDVRTTTDLVSALNPFSSAKNTVDISLKGYNPLKAHATKSLSKLGSKMIGFGMESDSDYDSDSESSSDEEYIPRKRGRPKGGALFGKIKKGFNKTIVQPTKQVVQKEIVQPTKAVVKKEIVKPTKTIIKDAKDDIKYVTTKDGLATDLLYKGVPVVAGTLGGVAGTMLTGGPMGGMAGSYAGQMAGKMIAQKVGRKTKMGSEAQRGVGTKKQSSNKTVRKYITKKKGGLSSDLLHHGVPIATGALGGMAGTMLGGPMGGLAGSQAGSYAGKYATDQLGKKIGVGLFGPTKKQKESKSQRDLLNKHAPKDNGDPDIFDNSNYGYGSGLPKKRGRPKKGSPEMIEKMAKLRALKNKK
jgi:hypothetical protein